MIILGHNYIKSEPFYFIKKIEDIDNTPSNSLVLFEFVEENLTLCTHCKENGIAFALIADSVKASLFANALEADYLLCDKALAPKVQKLADEYMFDAKVLLYSGEEADLEWASELGIDGIIFEKGIDYGSC
ncbi:MAG: hypothetical protein K0U47_09890 [Epsilonproteobacteria bacterium]|nr:hypothetical protein [Campylobacterota bacterium]